MHRNASGVAPLQLNYKEPSISYDRNGNILSYQRWGASTTTIQDNLSYNYYPGTNKLSSVTDASTSATTGEVTTQAANNYTYDGAGNLSSDAQSFISAGDIIWSPYGKILGVNVLGGLTQNIFAYDAMQNRIKKRKVSSMGDISTFYIRDAQGNVLAVYEKNGTTITWKEQHLYGSSRLGTVEPAVAWTTTPAATPYFRSTRILNYGWKRYEVNDHLGNVRALINDRKAYNGTTFTATLLDATDYFPFGAEMRKGTVATSYRYGFNGKEQDKNGEFGSLNHYDYGFRIYNPGIGRFLSVDPLTGSYPDLTPYQFASNTPIQAIDLDGLEAMFKNQMSVLMSNGRLEISNTEKVKFATTFPQVGLPITMSWSEYTLGIKHYSTNCNDAIFVKFFTAGPEQKWLQEKMATNAGRVEAVSSYPSLLRLYYAGNFMKRFTQAELGLGGAKSTWHMSNFIGNKMLENLPSSVKSQNDTYDYENTFIHFVGQALASAIHGSFAAKYVGDIHERQPDKQPYRNIAAGQLKGIAPSTVEDMYRDLINNEYGRIFGKILDAKYHLSPWTVWNNELSKNVLNDIQGYFQEHFPSMKFQGFDSEKDQQYLNQFVDFMNNRVMNEYKQKK